MSKTKTPFFSLGSHGTVGEALTTQKRGSATLVRYKPLPTDPYSLPQAYQRWLYQDYAYLWTQQSVSTRQQYHSAGVRFHLTGFQYWMKYHLANLPDIVGWWKLDNMLGATTPDSSKNNNPGTRFGASATTGLIDGAAYFDGINDKIAIAHHPTLIVNYPCSFEFNINRHEYEAVFSAFIQKGPPGWAATNYSFWTSPLWHSIRWGGGFNGVAYSPSITPALLLDTWYQVLVTYDGARFISYVDGIEFLNVPKTGNLGTLTWPLEFARYTTLYAKFSLDNFIIYNRCLDPTEALRHSKRRYPS